MAELIEHLPGYYLNSSYVKNTTEPMNIENENIIQEIEELKLQFFIDTSTYALSKYEEEYGLPINPNGISYNERRSRIKAKMRSIGVVNKEMIQIVVNAWTNADVEVIEDYPNFTFTIKFINRIGIPENMQDVYNAIGEIKPAHLLVTYEFKYRRYEELRIKTHQQLSTFTHKIIAEGVI